jgi:hypothetical protein
MPTFRRLIAQLHDIDADNPAQADALVRFRAAAVDRAVRPFGHATAWAPTVVALDSEEGGLDDIIDRAYLLDEEDGVTAYVALNETPVFDLLLAWRDAAVKRALGSR